MCLENMFMFELRINILILIFWNKFISIQKFSLCQIEKYIFRNVNIIVIFILKFRNNSGIYIILSSVKWKNCEKLKKKKIIRIQ